MNNRKYYWLCSYILESGSIILPGNWGRMVKEYTNQNNLFIYYREQLFEEVRLKSYSNLPSRLTSTFLCENIESLKAFKQSTNRYFDLTYEVELLDDKPIFETDWTYANFPEGTFKIFELEKLPYTYWKAENIVNKEILTENRIKIINKIDA